MKNAISATARVTLDVFIFLASVHSLFCRQRRKPPTASGGGIPLRKPRKSSADCHQFKITCKPFIINILHLLPTKLLPSHRVRHPSRNPGKSLPNAGNPHRTVHTNPCIFINMPISSGSSDFGSECTFCPKLQEDVRNACFGG